MGGSAATHNNFWQLFVRPAATSTWRLVTPPGVASNGGLVVASPGSGPVVAGFRPSQDLSYSPLATTSDNGAAWTPAILDAGLADVPDALAAAPAGGRLLALLANGNADISAPGATSWTTLASQHALAGTSRHPVPARQPHRGGVQPVRDSHAGRQPAPTPEPPASSPTPAAPGTRPGPRCQPPTPARPSPCSGSPPQPARPRRCSPQAPARPRTC